MARWFVDRSPQRGIPSVSLRRLLPEAQFVGCRDWEVTGCTADTRRLEPGQVYVAIPGRRHDGHTFVGRALQQGAAGVVVERSCQEAGRLQVVVPDSRAAHARILHALAGDPSRHMRVFGITGARGKGVTGLFLRAICEAAEIRCGGVSSNGWSDSLTSRPIGPDFPSPEALSSMLSTMLQRGSESAIVELNADELATSTVAEGLHIAAAIVTQVSSGSDDTNDPEQTRSRRRAYARLVRRVAPGGVVVVNADDPDAEILGACNLNARRISYGMEADADITATVERLAPEGTRLCIKGMDRDRSVDIKLIGLDRARQALAAAAAAWACGINPDAIVRGLESVTHLPGRFEPVEEGQPYEVRIDQASTAEDLTHALATLRSLRPQGRLICVIGTEGLGDRGLRQSLAEAAESLADQVIFTSDNPRSEDPNRILDDLLSGCHHPGRVVIEPDRREAIERALAIAAPGDGVLIAGKGRHAFQILADRVIPFDDRAVASRWLRLRWMAQRRNSA